MHKPDGCTFPNCFTCQLPDCQYSERELKMDMAAAAMRARRAAKPEQYRASQRRQKARLEARDPGHYARLQRELRKRKKMLSEST